MYIEIESGDVMLLGFKWKKSSEPHIISKIQKRYGALLRNFLTSE
jgi:hypothetical protein